jgi:hypothetical protein
MQGFNFNKPETFGNDIKSQDLTRLIFSGLKSRPLHLSDSRFERCLIRRSSKVFPVEFRWSKIRKGVS